MRRRLIATTIAALLLTVALSVPIIARAEGEMEAELTEPIATTEESLPDEGDQDAAVAVDDTEADETIQEETPDEVTEEPGAEAAEVTSDDAQPSAEQPEGQDAEVTEGEEPSDAPEPTAEEPEALTAQATEPPAAALQELDKLAAAHKKDVVSGRYRICSLLGSSLSLGIAGSSDDDGGKAAILTTAVAQNQRWEIKRVAGGYFTIMNVLSGKYLDISGADAGAKNGAAVVQWARRSATSRSQLWVIIRSSGGSYKIVSGVPAADGKHLVLSVSGGNEKQGTAAVLSIEKSGTVQSQLWNFDVPEDVLDALAAEHKSDVADGMYVFISKLVPASGKKLDLSIKAGSGANKASAVIYERSASGAKAYDSWAIKHTASGYVIITNCLTGKALQVLDSTSKVGTRIVQGKNYNGKYRNQLWVMAKQANGSYRLVSALAGDTYLTIKVSGGKKVSGTKTVLAKDSSSASQQWLLKAANKRYKAIPSLSGRTVLIETNLDASMSLGVYKSLRKAGKRVNLYEASYTSSMQWKVSFDDKGYAHITNMNSGRELGFKEKGLAAQMKGSFKWIVQAVSGNNYTLKAKTGAFKGKYLTLKNSKTASGTAVVAKAYTGAKNQLWQFDPMTDGLDGVDISGWNTGISYPTLGDFVIVKATEWNSDTGTYTSYNDYQDKADKALAAGKLIGFYHFATNPSTSGQSMAKQARGFIDAVSVKDAKGNYKYLGKAVLFLDWEDTSYSEVETAAGVGWAKTWLDYVYKKTGIMPMIYMNKNCTNMHDWSSVANAGYDLWGAQYLDKYYTEDPSYMITSFVSNPTLTSGWGAWGTPTLYQYTATCRLHGSKYYDVNKFYGTKTAWLKRAAAVK